MNNIEGEKGSGLPKNQMQAQETLSFCNIEAGKL